MHTSTPEETKIDLTMSDNRDEFVKRLCQRPDDDTLTVQDFGELAAWYLKTAEGRVSNQWYGSLRCLFERQIRPKIGDRVAAELKKVKFNKRLTPSPPIQHQVAKVS